MAYSQGEVVEAHRPQGEGPRQEAHVCEQHADGVLEGGQFLEDRGRLNQLPVRLRLLDLDNNETEASLGLLKGPKRFQVPIQSLKYFQKEQLRSISPGSNMANYEEMHIFDGSIQHQHDISPKKTNVPLSSKKTTTM